MTEKTSFSFDIDVNPGNNFKPLPDLVAFDLCNAYPMPNGNILLRNTRTGKRVMVMPEVHASLARCVQFKTLDEHVKNIIKDNPGMEGQQVDIRGVFNTMLESGIMVSASAVCKNLKHKNETVVASGKSAAPVVAIITWERPEALERLFKSIVANCNTSNIHSLYVIDDSRKPENIEENQQLIMRYMGMINAPLRYFGQQQQQAFIDKLTQQLPQHEQSIRFLADQSRWRDHWTSGLSRNWALLLSSGYRLVMMDDDTLCEAYDPEQPKPDISFSEDQREADFFSDEGSFATRRKQLNPDPVDRHMQCLGMGLADALNVLGQQHFKVAGLNNASARLISELKTDSPVLMTECGSLGCPGTNSNTWLPDISPASLRKMLASKNRTDDALNSRIAWIGRNNPHFSPRSNMSAMTGFDNRQLLPPYLPITRGEDRLFGNMLDHIFPSAVTLDYPWAVPHLPIPARKWRDEDLDFTPGDAFPLFFMGLVNQLRLTSMAGPPEARLRALSNWFDDLATAPGDSLASMYLESRMSDTARQMQKLRNLQNSAETSPAAWQKYLQNGIDQLTAHIDKASDEGLPLKGLPRGLEGDDLIVFWRETWSGFAAALNAWPEIREGAAEILEAMPGKETDQPASS